MKGQWIGNYLGTNSGQIVVEWDERPDCFLGWAYLYEANSQLPHSSAFIRTVDKKNTQEFEVSVGPITPSSFITPWDGFKDKFPHVEFPTKANVTANLLENSLHLKWKTNVGSEGTALLPRSNASIPSEIEPKVMRNWGEFRDYVSALSPRRYVFRGQKEASKWRLSTLFHRSDRADLKRLLYQDIPEIYRATINLTQHKFNLNDADERGAFYALVQHHGFPTPLLDWTYSPFVAAYFAFNDVAKHVIPDIGHCRIFKFDVESWQRDWHQLVDVVGCRPHFSFITPLALGNPRMVNQQAVLALTNVADLESYIRNREQEKGADYLEVIDLPHSSRAEVMSNLDMMGITSASLFPGIDGVCKYQKERLFNA